MKGRPKKESRRPGQKKSKAGSMTFDSYDPNGCGAVRRCPAPAAPNADCRRYRIRSARRVGGLSLSRLSGTECGEQVLCSSAKPELRGRVCGVVPRSGLEAASGPIQ